MEESANMKTTSRLLWAGVSLLGVASLAIWIARDSGSPPAPVHTSSAGNSPEEFKAGAAHSAAPAATGTAAGMLTAPTVSRLGAFNLWAEKFATGSAQEKDAWLPRA